MRRDTRDGFTLIEMLAVIATIAILAALLLPGIARAKAKGQQTCCLNNLRQVNVVVRMYADESGDAFPNSLTNLGPDIWTSYTKLMKQYVGVSQSAKLFACPADTFYYEDNFRIPQSQHLQSRYYNSSYAFNGGNNANNVIFPPSVPPRPHFSGVAGRKLNSVREPVKTVLITEFPALSPYSWHEPVRASKHYNDAKDLVSFVDGHAAFTKIYWDAKNVVAFHGEAWQYEPPAGYDYKWSGD